MADMVTPKQPYYLKGYTGHCPEMATRFGSSYSALSHKILLDPLVRHSHKLVLSDTEVADYMLNDKDDRCDQRSRKMVPEVEGMADMKYQEKFKFPIPPNYDGHLPGTSTVLGMSRTKKAEETIPCLKQKLKREHETHKEIEKINDIRYGKRKATSIEDKMLIKNEFTLPLLQIRPEFCGVIRNIFKDETPKYNLQNVRKSPYFMEGLDDQKYFIPGYTGNVPFGYAKFGSSYGNSSNCALKEFNYKYNSEKSTEWAPAGTIREEPAQRHENFKIYSEQHGIIPKYSGYIPGMQFRCGKTFGELTKDAKKWLNGDFSN